MEKLNTQKRVVKGKAQLQDDSIMGTNNSSIVSKRSVERLYFPDEPHYFRYFVKKPQRRAPLINRGYWLRMKAVDHVVREFLESPSEKQKVVINLGCGYDPLPWQCLSRYPAHCKSVKFVDIDYRDLMLKKRNVVESNDELHSMLTNADNSIRGEILFQSDQYIQLGCDLRDLTRLDKALASVINIESSSILFTAEVSITYMKREASDALIKWASTLPEAKFCLLEQLLPDGTDHPFAQTMMAHFAKLQTPLGAIEAYPTTEAQEFRFKTLGWSNVSARNLWRLWGAPDFITPKERVELDIIEAFDEWEEFAIFGTHYFLLTADNLKTLEPKATSTSSSLDTRTVPDQISFQAELLYSENPKGQGNRRFGAALPISISKRSVDGFGNFAGIGVMTRVNSCDIFSEDDKVVQIAPSPSARMCHTITDLGDAGAIMVGGRTSPDAPTQDCWLYHKYQNSWERLDDMPQPRYRHSAVATGSGSVLVSPGRENSQSIATSFLLWNRTLGWRLCATTGDELVPTYGSTFIRLSSLDSSSGTVRGIISGGISKDGVLQQCLWFWELLNSNTQAPAVHLTQYTPIPETSGSLVRLARFGATIINHNERVYILGGIAKDEILPTSEGISYLETKTISQSTLGSVMTLEVKLHVPQPLLIGISVAIVQDSLIIMGGSAVCFSFGTFWNKGCFLLNSLHTDHPPAQHSPKPTWTCESTSVIAKNPDKTSEQTSECQVIRIPHAKVKSAEDFNRLLSTNKPIILEGLDLGSCTEKWTVEYLKDKVGPTREVVVHEASTENMTFQSKNFRYVSKSFAGFIDEAAAGAKVYLRSLSVEKSSELPADISKDFPALSPDFRLPPELSAVKEGFHSSPLRVSGPVNMWLHYDVMANVLCQIKGSKRLLLFPPSDIKHFDFAPGASSTDVPVFTQLSNSTLPGSPHEALLNPGDVLFLPQLWLHTAAPTSTLSIAVNVFFRTLDLARYASGKDVYGNRDLQAYEKGRNDISKLVRSFESLPADVRGFYLGRLARELEQAL